MNQTWDEVIGLLQEILEHLITKGAPTIYQQGKVSAIKMCVDVLRTARDTELAVFDAAMSRDFAADIAKAEEGARVHYNETVMDNDLQDDGTPWEDLH